MTLPFRAFSWGGVALLYGSCDVYGDSSGGNLSLWRYPRTKTQSREEFISVIILIKGKLQLVCV